MDVLQTNLRHAPISSATYFGAEVTGRVPRVCRGRTDFEAPSARYRDNRSWWEPLKAADYDAYYARQYGEHLGSGEALPVATD